MSGGTAHELGQSVALLGGAIDQLRRDGHTDPAVLELLDAVDDRLRALTEELLAAERGERV
jgi:hypothetical protein